MNTEIVHCDICKLNIILVGEKAAKRVWRSDEDE